MPLAAPLEFEARLIATAPGNCKRSEVGVVAGTAKAAVGGVSGEAARRGHPAGR